MKFTEELKEIQETQDAFAKVISIYYNEYLEKTESISTKSTEQDKKKLDLVFNYFIKNRTAIQSIIDKETIDLRIRVVNNHLEDKRVNWISPSRNSITIYNTSNLPLVDIDIQDFEDLVGEYYSNQFQY